MPLIPWFISVAIFCIAAAISYAIAQYIAKRGPNRDHWPWVEITDNTVPPNRTEWVNYTNTRKLLAMTTILTSLSLVVLTAGIYFLLPTVILWGIAIPAASGVWSGLFTVTVGY
jgi:hypothetical protein